MDIQCKIDQVKPTFAPISTNAGLVAFGTAMTDLLADKNNKGRHYDFYIVNDKGQVVAEERDVEARPPV